MQPSEHVSDVTPGVVRVHLDGPGHSPGPAARESRDEPPEQGIVASVRNLETGCGHKTRNDEYSKKIEFRKNYISVEKKPLLIHSRSLSSGQSSKKSLICDYSSFSTTQTINNNQIIAYRCLQQG